MLYPGRFFEPLKGILRDSFHSIFKISSSIFTLWAGSLDQIDIYGYIVCTAPAHMCHCVLDLINAVEIISILS